MALYLADTSAWHRSGRIADRWETLLADGEIATCTPVLVELLYSARGPADYLTLAGALSTLRTFELDPRVDVVARRTQARLAERGQHRGASPIDLLVAGVAEANELTLLHYDRHFDAIARVTEQPTEWVARRGTLD